MAQCLASCIQPIAVRELFCMRLRPFQRIVTRARPFHSTALRFWEMEAGVTSQELEEALKTRLSAIHAEVRDVSGIRPLRHADKKGDVANPMKLSLYVLL